MIELTRERTDRIVMRSVPFRAASDPVAELTQTETWFENGSRYERRTLRCGRRTLTADTRRDPDVNTVWQIEHLLKDVGRPAGLPRAPAAEQHGEADCAACSRPSGAGRLGHRDDRHARPVVPGRRLFDMATYTVIAATEPACSIACWNALPAVQP